MFDFNILNINLNLKPYKIFDDELKKNLLNLLNTLKNEIVFLDLIIFSENFNSDAIKIIILFFEEINWISFHQGDRKSFINGGIIVASKWKIENNLQDIYINCDNNDCLTSRGPLYLRILHPIQILNIIANSFQEGNYECNDIRKLQINQLYEWIKNNIKYKQTELFLLIGHFNIMANEQIFNYLIKKLNANVIKHSKIDCEYILNLNKKSKFKYNFEIIDNIFIDNFASLSSIELSS